MAGGWGLILLGPICPSAGVPDTLKVDTSKKAHELIGATPKQYENTVKYEYDFYKKNPEYYKAAYPGLYKNYIEPHLPK